jgi:ubiquinone/menaquinone biosynthesis C-methylase UbiE
MATFDERAREWDTPERISRAARVAAAIREAVPLRRTDRLVDVGAGTGLLGLALADDVGEIVLIDPSAGMIEVATEKLVASGLRSVRAVRHDLLVDQPPADHFDVAVSLLVLHHLEDTAAALAASAICSFPAAGSPWRTSTPRTARSIRPIRRESTT